MRKRLLRKYVREAELTRTFFEIRCGPNMRRSRRRCAAYMSGVEIETLIEFLAVTPDAGDEIAGTGGCRKVRVAGRGEGKSGSYRVITFFSGRSLPLFLFYAYSKGDRDNIDDKQKNVLRYVTKEIVASYGKRPMRVV